MVLILSGLPDPRIPCGGSEEAGEYGGALAAHLDLTGKAVTRDQALDYFGRRPDSSTIAYELIFSPPRSWSITWALAGPEVIQSLEACFAAAIAQTLDYVEKSLSYTRRGRNGIRQIDASILWARFDHFSDRHERPDRHAHILIQGPCPRLR